MSDTGRAGVASALNFVHAGGVVKTVSRKPREADSGGGERVALLSVTGFSDGPARQATLPDANSPVPNMTILPNRLRFAVRSLRRSPGIAVAAIVTIALGIAATTVIFSAVNRVLLDPLPFDGGARMVYLQLGKPNVGFVLMPTGQAVEAWRESAHTFAGVEPYREGEVRWESKGSQERLTSVYTLPSILRFLGVVPERGRMFSGDDAPGGAGTTVVVSHRFWMTELGGRSDVLGMPLRLDGKIYDVAGVLPARASLFADVDVWMPLEWPAAGNPAMGNYSVIARLREGITAGQAAAELATIYSRLPSDGPFGDWVPRVATPQEMMSRNLRSMLPIMLGAVGLVLVIACVNVALLLLARGASRERELAVRMSLGATRRDLMRQLFVESAILAVAGGAGALLLVRWGISALSALRPESLSELGQVQVSSHVLLFALGTTALTAVIVGILPALWSTDVSPAAALRQAASDTERGASRVRGALVAVEMMLSVMLLMGACLLVRSFIELQRADLGFDPERLITVRTSLPDARYSTAASRSAFRDQLLERVRALPGVKGATVALGVPPRYGVSGVASLELSSTGTAVPTAGVLAMNGVRSEFFSVLGIRMVAGRPFTDAEGRAESGAVILGEGLARRLSPDGNLQEVVGQQLRTGPKAPWLTVVGVAEDVAALGITGVARHSQMYSPFGEGARYGGPDALPEPGLFIVRGSVDPATLSTLVRDAVRQIDSALDPPEISTVHSYFDESFAAPRFSTVLLAIFASLALILAMVGLFGVLSYAVARRTREIGIRMALGALPGDVRALVIRQGMRPVLVGLVVGVPGALLAARVLSSILYGVTPHDPAALLVAASILSITALLACVLPARRATRVDPVNALNAE